ncbi:MAG: MarR family transcriptional regulator [Planctomycetota bacterium]
MHDADLLAPLLDAAATLTRRLDGALGAIKGISYGEYHLLAALADRPAATATRVDLASAVGLTPSGVTRALRPLEKLGVVEARRDPRDARKSLTLLTDAGRALLDDARRVVADVTDSLEPLRALDADERERTASLLRALAGRG